LTSPFLDYSQEDKMHDISLRLRRAAVLTLAALGLSLATAATASAATLGGVDMQRACNEQNPGMGLAAVVTDAHNAYSWRCRAPWGYSVGIDVNRECVSQYGGGAYGIAQNPSNPYSWVCVR
jgi:hypothetical protein